VVDIDRAKAKIGLVNIAMPTTMNSADTDFVLVSS
jgi:hypothetical protein